MPLALLAQDARMSSVRASIIDAPSAPNAMSSVTRAASDAKTLHVMVGHSIFIDTKSRLRRVYVADPAILNSVTLTPNEIIVTAMNPGISSLTLLDEAGQAQSYVISSDIDIDGLRSAMSEVMRGDSVKIDGSGGRVTLSGKVASDAVADSAVKLASLYSKEVTNALTVQAVPSQASPPAGAHPRGRSHQSAATRHQSLQSGWEHQLPRSNHDIAIPLDLRL